MRIPFAIAVAAAGLTLASTATAFPVSIGFDPLADGEGVAEFYNGGLGSMGTGPGPAFGVSFSPEWIAGPPDVYGVPGGKSAGFSGTAIINFHAGWSGPTSFYYSGDALTVNLYDAADGLGTLLATIPLGPSAGFTAAGDVFPLVHSAVFISGGAQIDALTNGAFVIPEPGSLSLGIAGLAILGAAVRRKRARAAE